MKIAKATSEEVEALLNLMQVLKSAEDDGFPCKPDGTWEEGEDMEWFDRDNRQHLQKFYDRVMGCFADHPAGLTRTIGGYHLAMTNDVFDPDAETYEWHPTLRKAVEERGKNRPDRTDGTYGNVVIAGDVTAEEEKFRFALVIEFPGPEAVREALAAGSCRFKVFGADV